MQAAQGTGVLLLRRKLPTPRLGGHSAAYGRRLECRHCCWAQGVPRGGDCLLERDEARGGALHSRLQSDARCRSKAEAGSIACSGEVV